MCHVDPNYFLDEMGIDECNALVNIYNDQYKNRWEQTRYIAYIVAAVNSKQIKKPQDLLKFTWDEEESQLLPPEERKKMEEEMLEWYNKNKK